jgi:hypothetical protein
MFSYAIRHALIIPSGRRRLYDCLVADLRAEPEADGEPHTVVSIEGVFRSGGRDQDDSFTFKFDKPGTYKFVCSIHPQMKGIITVK